MFDKAFILNRINECKKLITFRLGRAELSPSDDDSDFLNRCLDSYGYWLKCAGSDDSFTESESLLLAAEFSHFLSLVLCTHHGESDAQVVQVLEQAPSRKLSVCRVLGQVSKAATEREKRGASLLWFPTLVRFPAPAKFLSNTRPVGGLA